ncbi:MAG: GAF domain-containing protein [Thermoanaerobaculales bacterium]|nr:GAF domain-containing protein [Thermoanaerobaculales bacterium]
MTDGPRPNRWARMLIQIAELVAKTSDPISHRATAAAVLHHKVPGVSWTGFYMLRQGDLMVDAYQGPVACLLLERHLGVCWAAIDQRETVIVADVEKFPGHIPCDGRTRSEIVVPLFGPDGKPIGVLDVDSHRADHFDDVDREGFESITRMLESRWNR